MVDGFTRAPTMQLWLYRTADAEALATDRIATTRGFQKIDPREGGQLVANAIPKPGFDLRANRVAAHSK